MYVNIKNIVSLSYHEHTGFPGNRTRPHPSWKLSVEYVYLLDSNGIPWQPHYIQQTCIEHWILKWNKLWHFRVFFFMSTLWILTDRWNFFARDKVVDIRLVTEHWILQRRQNLANGHREHVQRSKDDHHKSCSMQPLKRQGNHITKPYPIVDQKWTNCTVQQFVTSTQTDFLEIIHASGFFDVIPPLNSILINRLAARLGVI